MWFAIVKRSKELRTGKYAQSLIVSLTKIANHVKIEQVITLHNHACHKIAGN